MSDTEGTPWHPSPTGTKPTGRGSLRHHFAPRLVSRPLHHATPVDNEGCDCCTRVMLCNFQRFQQHPSQMVVPPVLVLLGLETGCYSDLVLPMWGQHHVWAVGSLISCSCVWSLACLHAQDRARSAHECNHVLSPMCGAMLWPRWNRIVLWFQYFSCQEVVREGM